MRYIHLYDLNPSRRIIEHSRQTCHRFQWYDWTALNWPLVDKPKAQFLTQNRYYNVEYKIIFPWYIKLKRHAACSMGKMCTQTQTNKTSPLTVATSSSTIILTSSDTMSVSSWNAIDYAWELNVISMMSRCHRQILTFYSNCKTKSRSSYHFKTLFTYIV